MGVSVLDRGSVTSLEPVVIDSRSRNAPHTGHTLYIRLHWRIRSLAGRSRRGSKSMGCSSSKLFCYELGSNAPSVLGELLPVTSSL